MKKIKVIAAVLITMLTVLAVGCGKKEDSVDVQADDNTVYKKQVDVVINRDKDLETEEVEEPIIEEPVKFDCMDEIKNARPDSGLIQVDDMLLQYGAKFSEIASVIEQSECNYEAEYNLSSVVPAGEELYIQINKDGDRFLMIFVKNREEETIELKDCITAGICAEHAEMNTYYAGCSNEEVSYTTVKDSMKDYEPEKEIFGSNAHGNKELGVRYEIPFQESNMYVYFIFDGITNNLLALEVSVKKYDSDVFWPW